MYQKLLSIAMICLLLVGCSSGNSGTSRPASPESPSYDHQEVGRDTAAAPETETARQKNTALADTARKQIRYVDLAIESKDFKNSVTAIDALVIEFAGFVQSSGITGDLGAEADYYNRRNGNFLVRIPSEKLDGFLEKASTVGSIVSKETRIDDVSDQYFDIEARLSSLRTQEAQLRAMLTKEGDLQYLLEVSKELSNVLYQIETLTGSKNKLDALIGYSTVSIDLREVLAYTETTTPITLGQRIQSAFGESVGTVKNFFADCLIFFIGGSPVLLLLLVLFGGLFLILRLATIRHRKRLKQMAEAHEKAKAEAKKPPHDYDL